MSRFHRTAYAILLLLLLTGVVLGAFGAHALKEQLSAESLNSFDTAVRYQITMALGAAFILLLGEQLKEGAMRMAFVFILIGIFLFSGSIYGLTALPAGAPLRAALGPVTPIGGLCFVTGYGIAVFKLLKGAQKVN